MTRLWLTTLSLSLALTTSSACDRDDSDDCPQGECVVVHPPSRPGHDEPPVPCPEACANLLGECASVKSDSIGDCDRDCRIVFTPAETECLASLTCGEATDVCFE